MATEQPQPLDALPLIRRKRAGEGGPAPEIDAPTVTPEPAVSAPTAVASPSPRPATPAPDRGPDAGGAWLEASPRPDPGTLPETSLRMKPRETIQLAAVHVRIPEQLARGLRLMSVLENRQAQVLVAEMLEEFLTRWNPNWKQSVPPKD